MQRDDIITGIKQAIERGYSLEKAKQTFINAGYSIQDVEDSSRVFLGISSSMPQISTQSLVSSQLPPVSQPVIPQQSKQVQKIILPSQPQDTQVSQSKPKSTFMLIFIIFLAIILVALLAVLIATVFYKEQVTDLFEPIFPSLFTTETFLSLI